MSGLGLKGLGAKIAITALSFSLVPLIALGVTMYSMFAATYNSKVQTNLATLAENKRQGIDLFLREQIAQLRTLAYSHSVKDLSSPELLESILATMQLSSKTFIDLGLINEEGVHVSYSGPYNLSHANYKNEKWFNEVMLRKVYVSDVFEGFRGFPHMVIAVQKQEKGKVWILRATIDSDIFDSLVRWLQLGDLGDAYLVNRAGDLQTRPRFGNKSRDIYAPLLGTPFSGAKVMQYEADQKEIFVGGIWLEQKEWLLVIEEDKRGELQPLFKTRMATWGVMGGGFVVIILGTLIMTRMIVAQQENAGRQQAQMNEELIQSSKMAALGKLAAGVAHEVNNPLAVIREKAGWMRDLLEEEDVKASPNFQEFVDAVDKIEQHVERAGTVVHRMLGFARRMEPVCNDLYINDVLKQTTTFLENEIRFRNIELIWALNPDLPTIQSDAAQIQQVILNLFNNAIDAIGRNGHITVKTGYEAETDMVSISLRDDGPGMDKEVQRRIFDPFYTTKNVGKGTGLGLSISYSIINKLGGSIRFESEAGKGTEFIILLPVKHHD
ncbi:ATP-binding protein [Desulfomicrobium sp. ZS1]|uniref:sensor histidine kinase n=1 Tax=Desulfomicrobium sp. ZS1 TaxID=2952228 RepID=UPI0020B23426|nr:PAS domain-containing sensor histidine kinase [Desulfomicrobium sp. ZS1]UTF50845.1 ATP-binding protein [Desulfomicrobium sp. ZS1]